MARARKLNAREVAAILAALRIAQRNRDEFNHMPQFSDEGLDPLTHDEIDELCEDINCENVRT